MLFQRETIREIGETSIATLTGQTIKLRNVASVSEGFGPVEIERKNRVRVTKVQAGVQDRVLGDVVRDIRERMASLDLAPGVSIEWGGEVEEQRKAFRFDGRGFAIHGFTPEAPYQSLEQPMSFGLEQPRGRGREQQGHPRFETGMKEFFTQLTYT